MIGGLARVLRGANETITDVDICPSLTGASLDRLRSALMQLEGRRTDGSEYRVTRESLDTEPIVELMTSQGRLNLVARPAGIPRGFGDLRRAATTEPIGNGLRPYVALVGDLAAMAAALHRDEDIARVPVLRRVMELRADRGLTRASWRTPGVRGPNLPPRPSTSPLALQPSSSHRVAAARSHPDRFRVSTAVSAPSLRGTGRSKRERVRAPPSSSSEEQTRSGFRAYDYRSAGANQ